MIFELKVGGHATVNTPVALDAAPERQAEQIAGEVVVPLVIRANEVPRAPEILLTELNTAVGATVLDDMNRTIVIAHHNHRAFADPGALEITRLGDFCFKTHVAPVAATEETLEFALVQLGIRVNSEGHSAGSLALPSRVLSDLFA
jgi:hypothetical protein